MQLKVLPVLSAQLITAPTGRPREIRNFAPEDPPRPAGRKENRTGSLTGHGSEFPSHSQGIHSLAHALGNGILIPPPGLHLPLPTRHPVPTANSQFLTITALTLRLRGLSHSILAPIFAPRSSPCKTGDRTRRPLWGLSQWHFDITPAAPRAEGPRGVCSKLLSGSCQLNSPGPPPRRFRGALLVLSRRPPLRLRPGGEQSVPAAHGRRSGRGQQPPRDRWRRILKSQNLTSLRHLERRKGTERK